MSQEDDGTAGSDARLEARAREEAERAKKAKFGLRQAIQLVITIVVLVLIFVFLLPKFADYGAVWKTITSMTWLEIASLFVVGLWNLFSYLPVLTAVLPGLTLRQAFVSTEATTAIANTFPAGGAVAIGLTYAMYNSWGFTGAEIVRSIIVSGVWNTFAKLGMPIIALGLLVLQGSATPGLVTASLIGLAVLVGAVVVFALLLRSEQLARAVGSTLGRMAGWFYRLIRKQYGRDMASAAVEFRENTVGLLERRWLRITIAVLVSHLSLFVVLLLCLRHVGVSEQEVSTVKAFAAFSFVRLLSALPITPGGAGIVELGYVAALGAGQSDIVKAQIVAATLVFRAITYFLPIPIGVGTWLFWRRNTSWRKPVGARTDAEGLPAAAS
jgi:putative heme transporter